MSAPSKSQSRSNPFIDPADSAPKEEKSALWKEIQTILAPIASLKLTVTLMALAIFIIFVGTLAQTKADIWEVMHLYFRASYMWVPLELFFPKSFFPHMTPPGGGFYFPGGATVGSLMLLNLLAAHLVRFKSHAKGSQLTAGWAVIALGCGLTTLVVLSGNSTSGVQDQPFISWNMMWYGLVVALAAACAGAWVAAVANLSVRPQTGLSMMLSIVFALSAVIATGTLAYIALNHDARLGQSSLRIVWQLLQGGVAGLVLAVGCGMVFGARGGIVLIHGGIALMMLGEALVSWYAVESQMNIREHAVVNFSRDIRTTELAFIDSSDPKLDDVTVIPLALLLDGEQSKKPIKHPELPVTVKVLRYFRNADLHKAKPNEENQATAGTGRVWIAEERKAGTGTDTDSKVDMSAAYVQFSDPQSGADLGTYLVSIIGTEVGELEPLTVNGKKYDVALRFKHLPKPYNVTLHEVRQDNYPGTKTPRNYSSDIQLVDAARNVDLTAHIWMNNPLRYAGETFYQSGYREGPDGKETTLAVVSNTGWMIPYVSCMLTAIGMGYHFVLALNRFLGRQLRVLPPEEVAAKRGTPTTGKTRHEVELPQGLVTLEKTGRPSIPAMVGMTLLFLVFVGSLLRSPKPVVGEAAVKGEKPAEVAKDAVGYDFAAFGRTPVVAEGRVKPIDTLARNTLRVVANQETFKDENQKTHSAVRWFLDVVARREVGLKHKVVRIEQPEVLALFNLEARPGSFRYSIEELQPKLAEFEKQVNAASDKAEKSKESLTLYERKLIELSNRIKAIQQLLIAFSAAPIPKLPSRAAMERDPRVITEWQVSFQRTYEELSRMKLPLIIPIEGTDPSTSAQDGWQAYPNAYMDAFKNQIIGKQADAAVAGLDEAMDAYQLKDAARFNAKTAELQSTIAKRRPAYYDARKIAFEAFFNAVSPFFYGIWLYFFAFVLTAFSWLFARRFLGTAATTLILLTFIFHFLALVARVYISGRPPVTNLYSSAVFIGFGCVLLGLILEAVFGRGLGNIVSAVAGFVTLWIALFLSADGDTFTVLQAVLDTQFWLATHVTCITLGYSTTFLAGLLGVLMIGYSLVDPKLKDPIAKDLNRMIYGTLCFAIFFSFVGTVLGGLWADDSWGRFWGWDPKENGALMIVLWNALVLHARWDRMIADRGMAVLAVLGNVITAWSWFGVNELGVGLHSYGFTEGRLRALGIVVLIHLLIAAAGVCLKFLPTRQELRPAKAV